MKPGRYPLADWLRWACVYSHAVYLHDSGLDFRSKLVSAKASIYRTPEYDVLTWAGSAQLMDWVINLTAFPPVPYAGEWVHPGFALAHNSLYREVRPHLDPSKPLFVFGHSLGGAMAELTARRIWGFKDLRLITLGKPNVFARWSNPDLGALTCQVSMVSGSDVVTRSPRFFYKPSPTQDMLYYANDGRDLWNPPKSSRRRDYKLSDIVKDHSVSVYQQRTDQYMNNLEGNYA